MVGDDRIGISTLAYITVACALLLYRNQHHPYRHPISMHCRSTYFLHGKLFLVLAEYRSDPDGTGGSAFPDLPGLPDILPHLLLKSVPVPCADAAQYIPTSPWECWSSSKIPKLVVLRPSSTMRYGIKISFHYPAAFAVSQQRYAFQTVRQDQKQKIFPLILLYRMAAGTTVAAVATRNDPVLKVAVFRPDNRTGSHYCRYCSSFQYIK